MLGYGFYYDPTYILVLVGAVISILASSRVNSTYSKYARVASMSGLTGAQAARRILDYNGLNHIRIERVSGNLTDHYDPSSKVLRLSDSTYGSASVAAIGVAAHECGHAVQDKESYGPLKLRSALVPVANLGSRLGLPMVILGLLLGLTESLAMIGVWVFSLSVLFQIVTLPVEFNASSRALKMLEGYHILGTQESAQCKKVLSAAALTYVAAAASSILQLLRLLLIVGGRRRDD